MMRWRWRITSVVVYRWLLLRRIGARGCCSGSIIIVMRTRRRRRRRRTITVEGVGRGSRVATIRCKRCPASFRRGIVVRRLAGCRSRRVPVVRAAVPHAVSARAMHTFLISSGNIEGQRDASLSIHCSLPDDSASEHKRLSKASCCEL
jgi:hypothetical protein